MVTRRRLLSAAGAIAAAGVAAACATEGRHVSRPASRPGSDGRVPDSRGEWWLPEGAGRCPTVVLVHGGYWQPGYDRHLEDPVAADLRDRGYLVWNIDYTPASGGWPRTLVTAAAAYDDLRSGRYAERVDPHRVAVVGHSAGGQLALWLASRNRLPHAAPGAPTGGWLQPALVVGQAPVAALIPAAEQGLGDGAVLQLCGGSPEAVPGRYAVADPSELMPAACPAVLIHGRDDEIVPLSQSRAYLHAAKAAAADVDLQVVAGGHFEHLDPRSAACQTLRETLRAHLG